MAVVEYKTVKDSINQLGDTVKSQLNDGWQPTGSILIDEYGNAIQAMIIDNETSETTTDYMVVKSPIIQLDKFVNIAIADGWKPIGTISRFFNEGFQAMKKGKSAAGEPGADGAKGDKGEPGADGAKGDKGEPGADGAKGDTPNLTVAENSEVGLSAASDLQELAEALSARIKALEDNAAGSDL